eukprot:366345-Chlamydomonas_euryale.AAC.9
MHAGLPSLHPSPNLVGCTRAPAPPDVALSSREQHVGVAATRSGAQQRAHRCPVAACAFNAALIEAPGGLVSPALGRSEGRAVLKGGRAVEAGDPSVDVQTASALPGAVKPPRQGRRPRADGAD